MPFDFAEKALNEIKAARLMAKIEKGRIEFTRDEISALRELVLAVPQLYQRDIDMRNALLKKLKVSN